MRFVTVIAAALVFPAWGNAQEQPLLQNTGAPMRIEFECTGEDISSGGLTCTEEAPCPVYLELHAVEPVGAKIFVTGNVHTASATLYSILLASKDGGKTWLEPHRRIRAAILEQIQFVDFETGWIGGQIVQAISRDPFLLLTTNGGNTWRRRPVFEEGRIGFIERFRFDSRDSGTLWIDRSQSGEVDSRYERYESMTGGESWMLREVGTRRIPVKEVGPRASNWRLRPHAASKSYRIERRQEETWQVVASFLIDVGECRPPKEPMPEPVIELPEPSEELPAEEPPSPRRPPRQPPTLKRKSE